MDDPLTNRENLGFDDSIPAILRTAAFAADKHRNQRRKDAEASPYINHPLALACLLAYERLECDQTLLMAALLHDTVEDTSTTFEEIERHFGRDVASIVREVTDDKSLDKAERKRLQVEQAVYTSRPARLVKLADKSAICATSTHRHRRIGRCSGSASTSTGRSRWWIGCAARMLGSSNCLMQSMRGGRKQDSIPALLYSNTGDVLNNSKKTRGLNAVDRFPLACPRRMPFHAK